MLHTLISKMFPDDRKQLNAQSIIVLTYQEFFIKKIAKERCISEATVILLQKRHRDIEDVERKFWSGRNFEKFSRNNQTCLERSLKSLWKMCGRILPLCWHVVWEKNSTSTWEDETPPTSWTRYICCVFDSGVKGNK